MPSYQMFWITTLNFSEFNSCLANEKFVSSKKSNAKEIASQDIKEIVLTGVNIGDYGAINR